MQIEIFNQSIRVENDFSNKFLKDFTTMRYYKGKDPQVTGQYFVKGTKFTHFIDTYIHEYISYFPNYTFKDKRDYSKYKVDIPMTCGFKPKAQQQQYIDHVVQNKSNMNRYLIDSAPGTGKSQPLDSLVLTPTGYREMGSISVGNYVIGRNGKPTKVTGVFPQGKIPLFKVVFEDGRVVKCNNDHLWGIYIDDYYTVYSTDLIETILDKEPAIPLYTPDYESDIPFEFFDNGVPITYREIEEYLKTLEDDDRNVELRNQMLWTLGKNSNDLESDRLKIIDVIDTGELTEMVCISVEAEDSLYLTNDCILTHNTYMASEILSQLSERTFIYMKATYLPKWIEDLKFYFSVSKDEVFVIQGRDSILKLWNMTDDELQKIKFILSSTNTLGRYIDDYATGKEIDIPPITMFLKRIQCNIMLVDECHQHFENIFKTVLVLNPKLLIGLSATLITYDKKLQSMYDYIFPPASNLSYTYYIPYAILYMIKYDLTEVKRLRFKRGQFGYSHNMLEQSIMKFRFKTSNYIMMVSNLLEYHYVNRMEKGEKAIIFVNSVDLATKMAEELSELHPDVEINRYIGGDDYQVLMNSQVTVSTPLKAGTAVDIKGLITVIQTVAMDSPQANVQAFGRLREIKGREVRYIQLYTNRIPQHNNYMRNLRKLMSDNRAKKIIQTSYPRPI